MSIRTSFDAELELLHIDLIKMGGLIEEAIEHSIRALSTMDKELAAQVVQNDRQIDDIEKAIETRCLRLLLRQQPVARDLRSISTALKMITDMERIGDQAADIADLSMRFQQEASGQLNDHLHAMAKVAIEMVHGCVDAFIKEDTLLANELIARDDEVDNLFDTIKNDVIVTLANKPKNADSTIDMLMIAKYLERIGDHAVNICEWVVFYQTGEHKNIRIL